VSEGCVVEGFTQVGRKFSGRHLGSLFKSLNRISRDATSDSADCVCDWGVGCKPRFRVQGVGFWKSWWTRMRRDAASDSADCVCVWGVGIRVSTQVSGSESGPHMAWPLRAVHLSRHKWPTLRFRVSGFGSLGARISAGTPRAMPRIVSTFGGGGSGCNHRILKYIR